MKIEMLLMCITFQFKSGVLTQGISKRNSTDNASWGGGNFQHREFRKEIQQTMQVGVEISTQRISKRNSTDNASWGGAQQREIGFPISTDNAIYV
ncbi:hypothetical protein ABC968_09790 [Staphylococcus aureus]